MGVGFVCLEEVDARHGTGIARARPARALVGFERETLHLVVECHPQQCDGPVVLERRPCRQGLKENRDRRRVSVPLERRIFSAAFFQRALVVPTGMSHSINSSRTVSCPTALVERLLPSESFVVAGGAGARPQHDSGTSASSSPSDAITAGGNRSSSAFLLFSCAVGSGLLTVPPAFVAGGLLGGSLLLLIFVVVEVATLLALVCHGPSNSGLADPAQSATHTFEPRLGQVQCTASSYQRSYHAVVRHYLGDRAAAAAAALIFADGLFSCAGGRPPRPPHAVQAAASCSATGGGSMHPMRSRRPPHGLQAAPHGCRPPARAHAMGLQAMGLHAWYMHRTCTCTCTCTVYAWHVHGMCIAGSLLAFRSAAAPLLMLLTRRILPLPIPAAAHYALLGVAGALTLPLPLPLPLPLTVALAPTLAPSLAQT